MAGGFRQLQIKLLMLNQFTETFYFPNVEFFGSANVIGFSYFVIILKDMGALKFLLGMFAMAGVVCISVLFELASRPYVSSIAIMQNDYWRYDPWSNRFRKSCQPLAIKIGDFHIITKERTPLIFQYCLRRIFYLCSYTNHNSP